MKIASFDIGIKNMAYCVFDISCNGLPKIVHWNVVNLTRDEVHSCSCTLKNGRPCKSKANYKNGEHFLCVKHSKDGDYLHSLSFIKKMKKGELISFLKNHFIDCNEFNKEKLLKKSLEICEKKLLHKITKSNANFVDLVQIGKSIKTIFQSLSCMDDLDCVYIENQISPIASRMKTIQGMLSQYFIMKYDEIKIEFCSSSNKLKNINKIFEKYEICSTVTENESSETTSKYRKHKKDAVYYCNQICDKQYSEWSHVLKTTKKDDLADCFLQGLYYIV
tara:strand:+ start:486 stop:1316 length:831 start_codon:yes stop_codon:yes gene_type:complete